MMSLSQARLRVVRLWLAIPVEGEIDWWRVVRIISSILIGAWGFYILMFIRSL